MAVRVKMNANIRSPGSRVVVGQDRRITVRIDAWGVIVTGGGGGNDNIGNGPPDGDNPPPVPPQPLGDESISIQHNSHEVEAGRVQVRMGSGSTWNDATKMAPSRRWRYTENYQGSGEDLTIQVRADAPPGYRGTETVTHTVTVVVTRERPDIRIDGMPSSGRTYNVDVPRGDQVELPLTGSVRWEASGIREVRAGVGKAAERVERVSGDWSRWRHTVTLRGFGKQTIHVRAENRAGNRRTERRDVLPVDTGAPRLRFTKAPRGNIAWPSDGTLTLRYEGNARDTGTGVRRVQWRLDEDGAFQNANDDSGPDDDRWSRWSVDVPIPEIGRHEVEFRAVDRAENEATRSFIVRARDLTPPVLRVVRPTSSLHEVLEEEGGVTVDIEGVAEDPISDIEAVEWAHEGEAFEPAQPLEDDWSQWHVAVHLEQPGLFPILVRASDVAGNTSEPRELRIRVREVL